MWLLSFAIASVAAAEFQSLLALEFTRGISVTVGTPRVVTFQPTPQSSSPAGVAFRVFFCRGGADVFLTIGQDKLPTPIVNTFQQLYVLGNVDATASTTGPGNLFYNLALYAADGTPSNETVTVDIVAGATQAAISERIPVPGGTGEVRIKSKVDRTNTIAWTPTGVLGDTYQVWTANEALPTGNATDLRNPDTACGAEASLTKRGDAIADAGSTVEMTFEVKDVMRVNTAVVVVTRANGYKAAYVSAFLTPQGGSMFTNVDGRVVEVTGTNRNTNANAASAIAITFVAAFVASLFTLA
jgi:hypothetical protein